MDDLSVNFFIPKFLPENSSRDLPHSTLNDTSNTSNTDVKFDLCISISNAMIFLRQYLKQRIITITKSLVEVPELLQSWLSN